MKKLKIYLDTSVISSLYDRQDPNKEMYSRKFWKQAKKDIFEVYLSPVVLDEISRCHEPKRSKLTDALKRIKISLLNENEPLHYDVEQLVKLYLEKGVLTEKSEDDCRHVAYACVSDCDLILSWNMKHLANYNTIEGVKAVNISAGYKPMPIYTPEQFLIGDEHND